MFMISLWLVHRTFRQDSLSAFLICGVGVALLVNLRIIGLILFGAVLGLCALDLVLANSMGKRKQSLLNVVAFVLSAILAYYAVSSWLWVEPIGEFIEAFRTLSNHPHQATNLFRGEILDSRHGIPLDYIPVWMGITTPPVVIMLALIGVFWILWRGFLHPGDVVYATPLRFGFLIIFLAIAPIFFIPFSKVTVYDHWRHVYFLYAPVSLFSICGAYWIVSRIQCESFGVRVAIYALLVIPIAVTVLSMVKIHPLHDSYFNAISDRNGHDYLVEQYNMTSYYQYSWSVLKEIVRDHPDSNIILPRAPFFDQNLLLPAERRIRTVSYPRILAKEFLSDRLVVDRDYVTRIYNNTLSKIGGRYWEDDNSQETIIRVALSSAPVARYGLYDVHLHEPMMVIVKHGCYSDLTNFTFISIRKTLNFMQTLKSMDSTTTISKSSSPLSNMISK